jgi:hypothetical protein
LQSPRRYTSTAKPLLIQAVQLRLAFHEARSEADKIVGSNLGVKEQEIVIEKLTKQVNAKRFVQSLEVLINREFLEQLRKTNTPNGQNGHAEEDAMQIDTNPPSS